MFSNPVLSGRYTAELPEDGVVVFLLGARPNKWWRIDKWAPILYDYARNVHHLAQRNEGLLHSRIWYSRTMMIVQYWRSIDDLFTFASNVEAPHVNGWRRYNRRVASDGTVGIYHETYMVRPGDSECMYVNMPAFGLGIANGMVKVGKSRDRARERMAIQRPARRPESGGKALTRDRAQDSVPSGAEDWTGDVRVCAPALCEPLRSPSSIDPQQVSRQRGSVDQTPWQ